MPRPFRLFTHYDFFSVFVPGFVAIIGFSMMLPIDMLRSPLRNFAIALLPTLILAFVFGQSLHSIADLFERYHNKPILNTWISPFSGGFRTRFAERMSGEGPELSGETGAEIAESRFRQACNELLEDELLNFGGNEFTAEDWERIYPTIQSQIYASETGRSITFQAIYAFCRSMFTLSLLLFAIYTFFGLLDKGILQIGPSVDFVKRSLLVNYFWYIWPLSLIGLITYWYAMVSYKRYFVQYLIGDFITVRYGGHEDA